MDGLAYIGFAVSVLWNLIVFAMYGMDKRRAKKRKWRISEATLIGSAFFMGGIGALMGMGVFRHKTNHLKFKVLVPLAVVANIGIVIAVIYLINTM
jgi:uncharacterized membrane protein YsdA (DUF1294 family)